MGLMVIKKYIRIYWAFLKYSLMVATRYRMNFFIEIFVEFGYAIGRFLFLIILFKVVNNIAGWTLEEMILLSGINMISTNFLLGITIIENLREIPEKIKNGEIDLVLLKPMNSMFMLTLGRPYFTSFISTLAGVAITIYAATILDTIFDPWHFLISCTIFVLGTIIAYCILVMFASLAFIFTNATTLIHIPEVFIFYYKNNPHQIFTGIFKYIFWLILPVVFMTSIPAEAYINGLDLKILFVEIVLTVIFIFLTKRMWTYMIRHYSSAGG